MLVFSSIPQKILSIDSIFNNNIVQTDNKKSELTKIGPIIQKLSEISDLYDYMNMNQNKIFTDYLKWIKLARNSTSPIEVMCNALTVEISLIYYLNLISSSLEPISSNKRYLVFLRDMLSPRAEFTTRKSAAIHLTQILQEDHEINEWFNSWKRDILDFHHAVGQMIKEEPMRTSQQRDIVWPPPQEEG